MAEKEQKINNRIFLIKNKFLNSNFQEAFFKHSQLLPPNRNFNITFIKPSNFQRFTGILSRFKSRLLT